MLMYKESTLISNKDSNVQKLRVFSNRYTINCCHKEALALLQRDDKGHRRYTFAELMMRFLVKIVGNTWKYIHAYYTYIDYIVVGDLEQEFRNNKKLLEKVPHSRTHRIHVWYIYLPTFTIQIDPM